MLSTYCGLFLKRREQQRFIQLHVEQYPVAFKVTLFEANLEFVFPYIRFTGLCSGGARGPSISGRHLACVSAAAQRNAAKHSTWQS